ncbi:transposase [Rufibacter psychrotolerans]|uniref:transposase n=1 Tax=Rufibacter psychrotolerans TaxID=2812556 RepID=UPI001966F306|nr:transposase [Rufibacter sp. SYSU D00308]
MRPDRKRNRLLGFDYRQDAFYFVTSCVKEMACVFGDVVNGAMHLNGYGQIAERQWFWLLEQYPYLRSHAFVVMPNHIHALVEISREDLESGAEAAMRERTGRDLSVPYGMQKIKSLSEIMGAYKTTTSKLIRLAGMPEFAWHRSFHDHIIRDEKSFFNIKNYIEHNPAKWKDDTFRR